MTGRHSGLAALVAILLMVTAGACSERGSEGIDLLADVAAGDGPSALKDHTPTPERRAVSFAVAGRAYVGDLYTSPEGGIAGLVLVPGVARAGKDDPRLVAFAHSLARARFTVLVPDLAGLRDLRVGAADARAIADAAVWLHAAALVPASGAIGISAISYAVGPALLAAIDPRIERRTAFVLAIGGYFDLRAAVRFFTTGFHEVDGQLIHQPPHPYAKWVFLKSNLVHVADPSDRALLAEMAARRLDGDEAPLDDLAARLGPEGRAVHALLTNRDPSRVGRLIDGLSDEVRAEMAALDPSRLGIDRLGARLILIHGRDDTVLPYTQSVALAAALPDGQASLYLLDGLFHVDSDFSIFDQLTLWDAAIELLEIRDGDG